MVIVNDVLAVLALQPAFSLSSLPVSPARRSRHVASTSLAIADPRCRHRPGQCDRRGCEAPRGYLAFLTVTVNAAVAVLALVSVAEHETRVCPTLNLLPLRAVQLVASAPSRSSCAVT